MRGLIEGAGVAALLALGRLAGAAAAPTLPAARLTPAAPFGPTRDGRRALEAWRAASSPRAPVPPPPRPPGHFVAFPANAVLPPGHVLADVPRIEGGLWLAHRDGCLWAREDGAYQSRSRSMLALLAEVSSLQAAFADFGPVFVCVEALAACRKRAPDGRIPGDAVFAIHRRRDDFDPRHEVQLVPDPTFDAWPETRMGHFDQLAAEVRRATERPPTSQQAAWVGNVATHPARARLIELAAAYPGEINATDSGAWRTSAAGAAELAGGHFVSLAELAATHAMLIDVAGVHSSFRLKVLMHARRPVLIQERLVEEFWYAGLRPFLHYVPVRADLTDLRERILWLRREPERAERIAAAGQAFAAYRLTRAAAVRTWVLKLASLPDAAGVRRAPATSG